MSHVPRPFRPVAVFARGLVIGAADLVPGVSGGTMALILGIYPRLIRALGALTRAEARSAVRAGRFGAAWREVDGAFLAVLALGIATTILTASRALHALLTAYPASVYAVFFGLIAASAWTLVRRIRGRRRVATTWAVVGAVAAFALVGLAPASTPDTPLVLMGSGALAVSALLLPGVSGSFMLVLLGKYATVLGAVARFDAAILLPLGAGMAVGLLTFARVLAAALARWPTAMLGLLAGFLVGSLRKVWPWQAGDGAVTVAAAPPGAWEAAVAAGLALAAALLVLVIDRRAGDA